MTGYNNQSAPQLGRSAMSLLCKGRAKYESGQFDACISDLTDALELDPKLVKAWDYRGMAKAVRGDFKGGILDCSEALKLEPKQALLWCHRGAMRLEDDDLDGAVEDCSEALRRDPNLAGAWSDRGGAKFEKGDLAGAIADFDEGLRLDPKNVGAWHNRGLCKHELGDFEGAIADSRRALRLNPSFRAAQRAVERSAASREKRANFHLEPLPPVAVAAYVAPYGFQAIDAVAWKTTPGSGRSPTLKLGLQGHRPMDGRTWYVLDCELSYPPPDPTGISHASAGEVKLRWRVQRRLTHLREGLHDMVKTELGEAQYVKHFGAAPFAHKGGLPGTSARLTEWLAALACCMNAGGATPGVVAYVLQFMDVADPLVVDECGSAGGMIERLRRAEADGNSPSDEASTRSQEQLATVET